MLIYANLRSPGRDPGVQSAFFFFSFFFHSNFFFFSPFPGHQIFIFWPVENCTTWNLRYLMLRDAGWALRHWRSCCFLSLYLFQEKTSGTCSSEGKTMCWLFQSHSTMYRIFTRHSKSLICCSHTHLGTYQYLQWLQVQLQVATIPKRTWLCLLLLLLSET